MNGGSTIVEFWRDKSIATTGESQKDEALLLEQVVEDADTDDEAVERRDPFDLRTQAIFGLAALLWLGFAGWATISTHQWQAGPAAWPGLVTTMLGFDVACHYPGATFLGSGGYHHHIGTNVWNSRGAGMRPGRTTGLAEVHLLAEPQALSAVRERRQPGSLDTSNPRLEVVDPWGTHLVITAA